MNPTRLVTGTLTADFADRGTAETRIERASREVIADAFAELLRGYLTRGQFARITVRIEEEA